MNRLGSWAAAVGVIAAAAVLVSVTPSDMTTSFEVVGRVGEPIHARLAEVEVLDVRLTDRLNVTFDETDGSTDGVWVVVDAVVTPAMGRLDLTGTSLRIGSKTYTASGILGVGDMMAQPYGAGVAQQGPIVFELPTTALDEAGARSATIVFETAADTRLDSVAAVVVDLTALEVVRSIDIDEPFVPELEP